MGGNILFDKSKNVYFIDLDGMGVDGLVPKFFTDEYVDPISKKNGTVNMNDDWYSFAIHAFYYLTYTHPFNGMREDEEKMLEIPEKMELKMSLLGNHKLIAPSVAETWDWMDSELIKAFLDIFENNKRFSIVPLLQKQYRKDYAQNKNFDENKSVTTIDKFEIREIKNPYNMSYEKIITDKAFIGPSQKLSLVLNTSNIELNVDDIDNIKNVSFSSDGVYIYIIFEDRILVYNTLFSKKIYQCKIDSLSTFSINENTLYYASSKNKNVIYKVEFVDDYSFTRKIIHFRSDMVTKCLYVMQNEKFIIIKTDAIGNDFIFCNDMEFHKISKDHVANYYNIIYDIISQRWLVIGDNGVCIVIHHSGNKTVISEKKFKDCNVYEVIFYKNSIFVPLNGKICVYDVNKGVEKEIRTDNFVNKDSRLYITKEGFKAITNSHLYNFSISK